MDIKMQKALHLHLEEAKKTPKHLDKIYSVFEKYDGWYVYNDYDASTDSWSGWTSSNNRLLSSLEEYDLNKSDHRPTHSKRLIAEAVIPGMVFKDLNGRLNAKAPCPNVVFKCHDLVSDITDPFIVRYSDLISEVYQLRLPFVEHAPVLGVSKHKDDWMDFYEEILKIPNGEGVILKNTLGKYTPGARNCDLMKIKCEVSLDCVVTDLEEGQGKYNGTLGRLVVQQANGQTHYISGMTDEERVSWWGNPCLILDKVVEVRAMKILSNGSLREGRFKAIRHNKDIKDID